MTIYSIQFIENHLKSSNPVSEIYLTRYIKLIEYARNNVPEKGTYTEAHHILPKSMFPKFKDGRKHKWNIIKLSARQHFIAHWMLWKAFRNQSMTHAFHCMCILNSRKNHKRYTCKSSRIYETLTKNFSTHQSKIVTDKWKNKEHREKMEKIMRSEECKEKHRKNCKEMWQCEEFKEKMKKIMRSEEYKEKHRKNSKKLWQCEKYKAKMKECSIFKSQDRNFSEKISKSIKQTYIDNPELRIKASVSRCHFIYTIIKENGEKYETTNLTSWAKENGYNSGNLYFVVNGSRKRHKDVIEITKKRNI